jgi:hypothetical protein
MTWFRRMTEIHWISLTETPESVAIQLIQSLLANTRLRPQEASPALWREDQRTECACPVPR